jgi:pimeloyl-ACP methyl ester carboxylesterase
MSIEPITGRYLTATIQGAARRIYFEEAGQGRPVICLHTAGADTRQWRHLMNDAEITASNRMIAFDMPWHGKSLPPEGFETEEYLLTTEAYIETVLAVIDGLGLNRPVLAGCSMGGRIALQLAALHPEKFSGFIAIEASDFQPAWYDIDWFHRPDAHGGEMGAEFRALEHAVDVHAKRAGRVSWGSEFLHQGRQPDPAPADDQYGEDARPYHCGGL